MSLPAPPPSAQPRPATLFHAKPLVKIALRRWSAPGPRWDEASERCRAFATEATHPLFEDVLTRAIEGRPPALPPQIAGIRRSSNIG